MRKGLLAGDAMWRWSRLPRGVSCPRWAATQLPTLGNYPTAHEHQVNSVPSGVAVLRQALWWRFKSGVSKSTLNASYWTVYQRSDLSVKCHPGTRVSRLGPQ